MTFEQFFERATKVVPYEFQRALAEGPLPELLEAGTGSGKTAAVVLAWLWRRTTRPQETPRRLVIVQPMRTLVEQTRDVIRGWLDVLELDAESRPYVEILMGGEIDEKWEGWPESAGIIIGTQDQILSRALMRGYAMSRYKWPIHFAWLHEDSLWVFDEVQLMGPGLSTSAQLQAFREHPELAGYRPAQSLWMSATLDPRLLETVDHRGGRRRHLRVDPKKEGGNLLHRSSAKKRLEKVSAVLDGTKRDDVASYIKNLGEAVRKAHEPGTLTLVVMNRVARARDLAQWFEKNGVEFALIHSRFRPNERNALRQEVLNGKWTGVLVATQAIEAGVDISAKLLFTEVAPWSSMVQRFGRCNRYAEHGDDARVYWIDLPDDDEGALPYARAELQRTRELLTAHADVGPIRLDPGLPIDARPTEPVLRRKDLLELFDTTPDLTGMDLDVSRFIRATDERDVHVAWWTWPKGEPPPDKKVHGDELCRVPVRELENFAKKVKAYRWDLQRSSDSSKTNWVSVDRFTPGMTVILRCEDGGYSERYGWTGAKSDQPTQVELSVSVSANEADDDDPLTYGGEYLDLRTHLTDTRNEMAKLIGNLAATELPEQDLIEAAHWHDVGKAHESFQEALLRNAKDDDEVRARAPLAKSPPPWRRCERKHFRHELASALAVLQTADDKDLVAYLVAAHHGKVRISIRARPGEQPPKDRPDTFVALGVLDGDPLPAVDLGEGVQLEPLTLRLRAYSHLGGADGLRSWRERTERLLVEFGPFRLAYLESLVRIADWRASGLRSREEDA